MTVAAPIVIGSLYSEYFERVNPDKSEPKAEEEGWYCSLDCLFSFFGF